MLQDFIRANRDELIARTRSKAASRAGPPPSDGEQGVPEFLTQLESMLGMGLGEIGPDESEMAISATLHGADLLRRGFTVGQVVHDYGDVCQAVTELAIDRGVSIGTDEFRLLNRCLDNAIASAVTEYGRRREVALSHGEVERIDLLAHDLRSPLSAALLSLALLQKGDAGANGTLGVVLERSLASLGHLIDRSEAEAHSPSPPPPAPCQPP